VKYCNNIRLNCFNQHYNLNESADPLLQYLSTIIKYKAAAYNK